MKIKGALEIISVDALLVAVRGLALTETLCYLSVSSLECNYSKVLAYFAGATTLFAACLFPRETENYIADANSSSTSRYEVCE